jgi:hypothetical protein
MSIETDKLKAAWLISTASTLGFLCSLSVYAIIASPNSGAVEKDLSTGNKQPAIVETQDRAPPAAPVTCPEPLDSPQLPAP